MKKLLICIPLLLLSCSKDIDITYRNSMRSFVQDLSSWSKAQNPDFLIIPQNGHDLFSTTEEPDGDPATTYLNAIDGAGQEDLFYGYTGDNIATPQEDIDWITGFLDIGKNKGITILVTNYCSDSDKMANGYSQSFGRGYVSFSAHRRELDSIPNFPIHNTHNEAVTHLNDVQNFLYLIDPALYTSKEIFLSELAATNYDLFIIDLFVLDTLQLTKADIARLQKKPNGQSRLAVCYMSIGEAEDYRSYWKSDWEVGNPSWIKGVNPDWPGNYKVEYWQKEWQDIIFGNDSSYLQKILDSGFDGVYLDLIEAFEHFETTK